MNEEVLSTILAIIVIIGIVGIPVTFAILDIRDENKLQKEYGFCFTNIANKLCNEMNLTLKGTWINENITLCYNERTREINKLYFTNKEMEKCLK